MASKRRLESVEEENLKRFKGVDNEFKKPNEFIPTFYHSPFNNNFSRSFNHLDTYSPNLRYQNPSTPVSPVFVRNANVPTPLETQHEYHQTTYQQPAFRTPADKFLNTDFIPKSMLNPKQNFDPYKCELSVNEKEMMFQQKQEFNSSFDTKRISVNNMDLSMFMNCEEKYLSMSPSMHHPIINQIKPIINNMNNENYNHILNSRNGYKMPFIPQNFKLQTDHTSFESIHKNTSQQVDDHKSGMLLAASNRNINFNNNSTHNNCIQLHNTINNNDNLSCNSNRITVTNVTTDFNDKVLNDNRHHYNEIDNNITNNNSNNIRNNDIKNNNTMPIDNIKTPNVSSLNTTNKGFITSINDNSCVSVNNVTDNSSVIKPSKTNAELYNNSRNTEMKMMNSDIVHKSINSTNSDMCSNTKSINSTNIHYAMIHSTVANTANVNSTNIMNENCNMTATINNPSNTKQLGIKSNNMDHTSEYSPGNCSINNNKEHNNNFPTTNNIINANKNSNFAKYSNLYFHKSPQVNCITSLNIPLLNETSYKNNSNNNNDNNATNINDNNIINDNFHTGNDAFKNFLMQQPTVMPNIQQNNNNNNEEDRNFQGKISVTENNKEEGLKMIDILQTRLQTLISHRNVLSRNQANSNVIRSPRKDEIGSSPSHIENSSLVRPLVQNQFEIHKRLDTNNFNNKIDRELNTLDQVISNVRSHLEQAKMSLLKNSNTDNNSGNNNENPISTANNIDKSIVCTNSEQFGRSNSNNPERNINNMTGNTGQAFVVPSVKTPKSEFLSPMKSHPNNNSNNNSFNNIYNNKNNYDVLNNSNSNIYNSMNTSYQHPYRLQVDTNYYNHSHLRMTSPHHMMQQKLMQQQQQFLNYRFNRFGNFSSAQSNHYKFGYNGVISRGFGNSVCVNNTMDMSNNFKNYNHVFNNTNYKASCNSNFPFDKNINNNMFYNNSINNNTKNISDLLSTTPLPPLLQPDLHPSFSLSLIGCFSKPPSIIKTTSTSSLSSSPSSSSIFTSSFETPLSSSSLPSTKTTMTADNDKFPDISSIILPTSSMQTSLPTTSLSSSLCSPSSSSHSSSSPLLAPITSASRDFNPFIQLQKLNQNIREVQCRMDSHPTVVSIFKNYCHLTSNKNPKIINDDNIVNNEANCNNMNVNIDSNNLNNNNNINNGNNNNFHNNNNYAITSSNMPLNVNMSSSNLQNKLHPSGSQNSQILPIPFNNFKVNTNNNTANNNIKNMYLNNNNSYTTTVTNMHSLNSAISTSKNDITSWNTKNRRPCVAVFHDTYIEKMVTFDWVRRVYQQRISNKYNSNLTNNNNNITNNSNINNSNLNNNINNNKINNFIKTNNLYKASLPYKSYEINNKSHNSINNSFMHNNNNNKNNLNNTNVIEDDCSDDLCFYCSMPMNKEKNIKYRKDIFHDDDDDNNKNNSANNNTNDNNNTSNNNINVGNDFKLNIKIESHNSGYGDNNNFNTNTNINTTIINTTTITTNNNMNNNNVNMNTNNNNINVYARSNTSNSLCQNNKSSNKKKNKLYDSSYYCSSFCYFSFVHKHHYARSIYFNIKNNKNNNNNNNCLNRFSNKTSINSSHVAKIKEESSSTPNVMRDIKTEVKDPNDYLKQKFGRFRDILKKRKQKNKMAALMTSPKKIVNNFPPLKTPRHVSDSRFCLLCGLHGDMPSNGPGRLIPACTDRWVHSNCMLWTCDVYETVDGCLMGSIYYVHLYRDNYWAGAGEAKNSIKGGNNINTVGEKKIANVNNIMLYENNILSTNVYNNDNNNIDNMAKNLIKIERTIENDENEEGIKLKENDKADNNDISSVNADSNDTSISNSSKHSDNNNDDNHNSKTNNNNSNNEEFTDIKSNPLQNHVDMEINDGGEDSSDCNNNGKEKIFSDIKNNNNITNDKSQLNHGNVNDVSIIIENNNNNLSKNDNNMSELIVTNITDNVNKTADDEMRTNTESFMNDDVAANNTKHHSNSIEVDERSKSYNDNNKNDDPDDTSNINDETIYNSDVSKEVDKTVCIVNDGQGPIEVEKLMRFDENLSNGESSMDKHALSNDNNNHGGNNKNNNDSDDDKISSNDSNNKDVANSNESVSEVDSDGSCKLPNLNIHVYISEHSDENDIIGEENKSNIDNSKNMNGNDFNNTKSNDNSSSVVDKPVDASQQVAFEQTGNIPSGVAGDKKDHLESAGLIEDNVAMERSQDNPTLNRCGNNDENKIIINTTQFFKGSTNVTNASTVLHDNIIFAPTTFNDTNTIIINTTTSTKPSGITAHNIPCSISNIRASTTTKASLISNTKASMRSKEGCCMVCGGVGATVMCFSHSCGLTYHLPCAINSRVIFLENKMTYCRRHLPYPAPSPILHDISIHRKIYVPSFYDMLVCSKLEEPQEHRTLTINKTSTLSPDVTKSEPEVELKEEKEVKIYKVLRMGSLMLLSFGKLYTHHVNSTLFHDRHHVYPIGYKVVRVHWSCTRVRRRCAYVCAIHLKQGRPLFVIKAYEDDEWWGNEEGEEDNEDYDDALVKNENFRDDSKNNMININRIKNDHFDNNNTFTTTTFAITTTTTNNNNNNNNNKRGHDDNDVFNLVIKKFKHSLDEELTKDADINMKNDAGKLEVSGKVCKEDKDKKLMISHLNNKNNNNFSINKKIKNKSEAKNTHKRKSRMVFKDCSCHGVWMKVVERMARLNKIDNIKRGEDVFGLNDERIVRVIESMPGVELLVNYQSRYGKNPAFQLSLPVNSSGCIRSEIFTFRPHGLRAMRKSTKDTDLPDNTHMPTHNHAIGGMTLREISMLNDDINVENYLKNLCSTVKSQRYKALQREWRSNVYLRKSDIQGMGLFAARDIDQLSMVIEYVGELIRNEVAERREAVYESQERGTYMFRLDELMVVDATIRGGLARFINHSCDPNCFTEVVQTDMGSKIIIVAKRKILCGEELSYDYKFNFEEEKKLVCLCGAERCLKWMN